MELPADKIDYNKLIGEFIADSRVIIIKAKIAELYKQYGEYSLWLLISALEKYQPAFSGIKASKEAIYKLCKEEIERQTRKEKLEITRLQQQNTTHWIVFGLAIAGLILSIISLTMKDSDKGQSKTEYRQRHCYCKHY